MVQVEGREISQVAVVDDDEYGRAAFSLAVEELEASPIDVTGPVASAEDVLGLLANGGGVICDHHMTVSTYSRVNGAQLVAEIYSTGHPVILCTKWEDAHIDEMRLHRARIPVLLRPDDLTPDAIVDAFSRCLREYRGEWLPDRRPWRTLVRFEDVEAPRRVAFAVIPAWDANQVVRLPFDCLPDNIDPRDLMGQRVHAKVNIGAERHEELFFVEWELDGS